MPVQLSTMGSSWASGWQADFMASLLLVLLRHVPMAGRIWMEWEGTIPGGLLGPHFLWLWPARMMRALQSVDLLTDSEDVHLRPRVCSLP